MSGYIRLVPFRSTKYQFIRVISILRNGTEQEKKKTGLLEKTEIFSIICYYLYINIVDVCMRHVSEPKQCMSNTSAHAKFEKKKPSINTRVFE